VSSRSGEPCPHYSPLTASCEYGDCTPGHGCVDEKMADVNTWLSERDELGEPDEGEEPDERDL